MNLTQIDIQKKCEFFNYDESQYHALVHKLQNLDFNLDQCHRIVFQREAFSIIDCIEKNIEVLVKHLGFRHEQIARIAVFGGHQILNSVILSATPLLSFGYTHFNIQRIAISTNAIEKLEFLLKNHHYLMSSGHTIKDITHQLISETNPPLMIRREMLPGELIGRTVYDTARVSPSQFELKTLTAFQPHLVEDPDRATPYSEALSEEDYDRPTPFSHALSYEFNDRLAPYNYMLSDDFSDRPTPLIISRSDAQIEPPPEFSPQSFFTPPDWTKFKSFSASSDGELENCYKFDF
jgi:hypothetical protein